MALRGTPATQLVDLVAAGIHGANELTTLLLGPHSLVAGADRPPLLQGNPQEPITILHP